MSVTVARRRRLLLLHGLAVPVSPVSAAHVLGLCRPVVRSTVGRHCNRQKRYDDDAFFA